MLQTSPEEIKKIRKKLLLNLVLADLVIGTGLLVYFRGGHQVEMAGFFLALLGIIWVIMSVSRMIRFKKFLAEQQFKK